MKLSSALGEMLICESLGGPALQLLWDSDSLLTIVHGSSCGWYNSAHLPMSKGPVPHCSVPGLISYSPQLWATAAVVESGVFTSKCLKWSPVPCCSCLQVVGQGKCSVMDTYWQTETGGHVVAPLPGVWPAKPGSATLPFFGVQPAMVNEQVRQVWRLLLTCKLFTCWWLPSCYLSPSPDSRQEGCTLAAALSVWSISYGQSVTSCPRRALDNGTHPPSQHATWLTAVWLSPEQRMAGTLGLCLEGGAPVQSDPRWGLMKSLSHSPPSIPSTAELLPAVGQRDRRARRGFLLHQSSVAQHPADSLWRPCPL